MFGMMEALLSFIRRQVGLRTDAADATGSAHAKLVHLNQVLQKKPVIASDTLRYSADTPRTATDATDYVKLKEIQTFVSGTIRVAFDIKNDSYPKGGARGQIYKNGVAVGIERSGSQAYSTHTEDLIFETGNLIQLYAKSTSGSTSVTVRNFRIYYDTPITEGLVTKD
jgi:hypothetical protein